MNTYKVAISRYPLPAKIPPKDPMWKKFNASFDNLDIEPTTLMGSVYLGQAMTTHHKDHWRTAENYICGQHIGLDFDSENEASAIPNLVKDKFIIKYASFIHTTISHKPEAPRARVVFLLDNPIMQAKNYTLAVTALLWLFGTADRQCKDAVRFFYGAPGCKIEAIGNILPLDIIKNIISKYQASGLSEKRKSTSIHYQVPATQQEVADALNFIPPWSIPYDDWVEVLMGIHAAFGEGGYNLAMSWADGKPGEVEDKWKSFKQGGNVTGAITIATVFGFAKKFGWKKHNEVSV
jgi:hypothetical protein